MKDVYEGFKKGLSQGAEFAGMFLPASAMIVGLVAFLCWITS